MSFDVDSDGDYTPAVWGDSSPIPPYGDESLRETGLTKEDFMRDLVNGYFVGKKPEDLADQFSMEDMDFPNMDAYAGSSVSVNNMLRALKGLQEYHLNKQTS